MNPLESLQGDVDSVAYAAGSTIFRQGAPGDVPPIVRAVEVNLLDHIIAMIHGLLNVVAQGADVQDPAAGGDWR